MVAMSLLTLAYFEQSKTVYKTYVTYSFSHIVSGERLWFLNRFVKQKLLIHITGCLFCVCCKLIFHVEVIEQI